MSVRTSILAISCLAAFLGLAGCGNRQPERGPMEQAGHDIDRSARQAGHDIDHAVDEAGDEIDESTEHH